MTLIGLRCLLAGYGAGLSVGDVKQVCVRFSHVGQVLT